MCLELQRQLKQHRILQRVLWNNTDDTSNEIIPMDIIGQQIGEVKRNVNPMPKKNGDSNTLPVGTKLYEIKGISIKEAIAIQRGGEYNKALNHGGFSSDETSVTMRYLIFLLMFILVLGLAFFRGFVGFVKVDKRESTPLSGVALSLYIDLPIPFRIRFGPVK